MLGNENKQSKQNMKKKCMKLINIYKATAVTEGNLLVLRPSSDPFNVSSLVSILLESKIVQMKDLEQLSHLK